MKVRSVERMDRQAELVACVGLLALIACVVLAIASSRDATLVPWLVTVVWACVAYFNWRMVRPPLPTAFPRFILRMRWLIPFALISVVDDLVEYARTDLAPMARTGWIVQELAFAGMAGVTFVVLHRAAGSEQ